MIIQLTIEQQAELQALVQNTQDDDRFARAYDYLRNAMGGDVPVEGANPAVWNWLRGAADVNRRSGPFSAFIRAYTAAQ